MSTLPATPLYHVQKTGEKAGDLVPCPAKVKCRNGGKHYTEEQVPHFKNQRVLEQHLGRYINEEDEDAITLKAVVFNANMIIAERLDDPSAYKPLTEWGYEKALEFDAEHERQIAELIAASDISKLEQLTEQLANTEGLSAEEINKLQKELDSEVQFLTQKAAELENIIQFRINSAEFDQLLKYRDESLKLREKLAGPFKPHVLLHEYSNTDYVPARFLGVDGSDPYEKHLGARKQLLAAFHSIDEFDYESVREIELDILEISTELDLLRNQINSYKDVTAPAVNHEAEIQMAILRATGQLPEYTESTLNNLVQTAYVPSGSKEWLEQRQGGIGGSDVGAILGVKDAYNSRTEILNSKLDPISEEEVAKQLETSSQFKGPLGRGNAWEKRIFVQALKDDPERVAYCKYSWSRKDRPYQFANFDGMLMTGDTPTGILEIKTSSDPDEEVWGTDLSDINSIPETYKKQIFWYGSGADFSEWRLDVVIDDRELRRYGNKFTEDDYKEMASDVKRVGEFVQNLEEIKKGEKPRKAPIRTGFSRDINMRPTTKGFAKAHAKIIEEVAVLRGKNPNNRHELYEIEREFQSIWTEDMGSHQAHKQLYINTANQAKLPPYVALDIETNGMAPYYGHIIEVGYSIREGYAGKNEGRESAKKETFYSPTKKSLAGRGTGMVEVHGITEEMVAGAPTLGHGKLGEEESAKILKDLKRVGIMQAHNASFERRWLSTHIKGFANAVKKGEIRIFDTMSLTRKLAETPSNRLQDLTTYTGIDYADAHRAYNDANMMGRAYERLLHKLSKDPNLPPPPEPR